MSNRGAWLSPAWRWSSLLLESRNSGFAEASRRRSSHGVSRSVSSAGSPFLLPLAELVLAAALLADAVRDTSWSLWAAALVLATFLGGQLFLLLKMSRKVGAATCGCFGRPGPVGVSSLSRTAVLLGLAVVGVVIP